jgi:hypothetical protein
MVQYNFIHPGLGQGIEDDAILPILFAHALQGAAKEG